ncbi:hypothetical protein [Sphingobacterium sp. SGL-16]|nr:hypothetical protein [Sphingobacterium sp. SGL-16]NGM73299.1 hypothetical protein [Sphingobacterium sp. SGL-16]
MILFIALLWSTGTVCTLQNESTIIANNGEENTGDKSIVRPPIPPIPPILPLGMNNA